MSPDLIPWVVAAGAVVTVLFGTLVLFARFYRKVDQGRALVISKISGDPVVTFSGALVLPIIHRAEEMDISVKTIVIDRRGGKASSAPTTSGPTSASRSSSE